MRKRIHACCLLVAVGLLACPGSPQPDLVVSAFLCTGDPTFDTAGDILVPVRLRVLNQGNAAAGPFFVGVICQSPTSWYQAPFTVPGEPDSAFPETDGSLAPGEFTTFEGNVVVPGSEAGATVELMAVVDYCSASGVSCRVRERHEDNNQSLSLYVTLSPSVVVIPPEL